MADINSNSYPIQSRYEAGLIWESALKKLIEGNKRYISGKAIHPHQTAKHRTQVAESPHPFAIILSCSDSRVPPEIIFDRGIGDLFVIRVAGNILNTEITGSIEYAVQYFGVNLIVVMGHKRCGAVLAALQGGKLSTNISSLVDALLPAVEKARAKEVNLVDNTVRENIIMVVDKLKLPSSFLGMLAQDGKLQIRGACYDVDNGMVNFNY
jgi:carbonic anhydrase